MKIFDYTNGVKGEELGERKRASWARSHKWHNGEYLSLKANRPMTEAWLFHTAAGIGGKDGKDIAYTPGEFGVEAICFCIGLMRCGTDESWDWIVLGTNDWVKQAVKNGWLT